LAFIYGLEGAFFIKVYGELNLEIIAILTTSVATFGLFSLLLNKVNYSFSLNLPKLFLILKSIIYGFMWYLFGVQAFVISMIILESLFGLLYNHRTDVISNKLKDMYDLSEYGNITRFLNAFGGLLGGLLAIVISSYATAYIIVILTTTLEAVILMIMIYLIDLYMKNVANK
jgi:hypothetical protein